MKKLTIGIAFAGVFGLAAVAHADGKEMFIEQKCNKCHAVKTHDIEKKKKKLDGEDLSEVGKKHDAEWMTQYIKKEIKLDGKKHKNKWKGSDEELKTIVDWLTTLKG